MIYIAGNPIDFSAIFNTPLWGQEWDNYYRWRRTLPPNLQGQRDYDLQGAFKDGMIPDGNQHFKDIFKKPNHPSFSIESQYSNPQIQGGSWRGEEFTPSILNMIMNSWRE